MAWMSSDGAEENIPLAENEISPVLRTHHLQPLTMAPPKVLTPYEAGGNRRSQISMIPLDAFKNFFEITG